MIYDLEVDKIGENTPYWYVRKNISDKQNILDVGCATGYLGAYLKRNFDLNLVGVDYDNYYLKKAAERNVYSDLIKLDLNNFDNELVDYVSHFDKIILCDVLEHLNNPMDVLTKLSQFLKDDGNFLIDVPNIAHSSIKYNLLLNKFDYTPFGLLDETHVRFFTCESLIKDLSKNNFLIKDMEFIFLGPGQFHDQIVDYAKYPQEIIDLIENDLESSIYQIFTVFESSDLDFETLNHLNYRFNEFKPDIIQKKEKYVGKIDYNPLKSLEDSFKDKEKIISYLNHNIDEKTMIVSQLEKHIYSLNEEINGKAKIILKHENTIQNKNSDINRLDNNINRLDNNIKNLKLVISTMKNSYSWKFTKPFRNLSSFFKR